MYFDLFHAYAHSCCVGVHAQKEFKWISEQTLAECDHSGLFVFDQSWQIYGSGRQTAVFFGISINNPISWYRRLIDAGGTYSVYVWGGMVVSMPLPEKLFRIFK